MKSIPSIVASLLLFASTAFAQVAQTSTTLAAAVAVGDQTITVASATGFAAKTNSTNTVLYVDREAMRVVTVSGTSIGVERGNDGTAIASHASGAVIFYGPPGIFSAGTPSGSCTATREDYLPRVVGATGNVWNCINGIWEGYSGSYLNVGTPNTGVTARETGDNRRHVTQLSFTDLAVGSAVGAASLGIGKLIYTLPAGAIVAKSSYIGVGLAGSGSTCDANTPVGGLGTVIATGAVAVLSGTATFQNIMAGATYADVNSTVKVNTVGTVLAIEAASAHTVHFNVAVAWAGACDITATGAVVLEWMLLQ